VANSPTVTCLHPNTTRRPGESLTRQSSTSPSGVQNSVESSLLDYSGRNEVILRWDPHGKFIRFNDGNRLVSHLMVNYSKAKTAFENRTGRFDALLEPHQTLTITGTESDLDTLDRPVWEVLDFFEEIEREFRYIPDWSWIYNENMSPTEHRESLDDYTTRLDELYEGAETIGLDHVEFIPLAKGLHDGHFAELVKTFERWDVDRFAIYGTQTRSLDRLVNRVDQAIDVLNPEGVLVIGRQAPEDVAEFPDLVDGVAGFWNWKKACNLTADGYSSEDFATWFHKVKNALRTERTGRQIGLNSATQEVRSDGGYR